MSDSVPRKATEEEIKEYLIAFSKDITELNNVLRDEIETGGEIGYFVYLLLSFGFSLNRMTKRRYTDIAEQFTKHISLKL